MTDLSDLESATDLDVVASQLVLARKRIKQPTVDLTGRLTDITIQDTMNGASSLTLRIIDEDFELFDSGFFDVREDGRLDPIEINYPEGSDDWWRVTQVTPNANGIIEVVLMERVAVFLMSHHGPVKMSRAKKTRAEFFKMLCDKVKASGGIHFHSKELHKKQPVEKDKPVKPSKKDRRTLKSGGIHTSDDLKIAGGKAKKPQLEQVQRALDQVPDNAPDRAILALLCAGIGESGFKPVVNSLGYGGVFQGAVSTPGTNYFSKDDTEEEARYFLKGGKGYQGGGAIAQANAHPDKSPGMIAADVEKSWPSPQLPTAAAAEHHYQQYLPEAEKLLDAYGGGIGGGGSSYRKQYNFQIGTDDNPHETYWDGMQRLAGEVNWPFFVDGRDVYFDDEMTLIQQAPVAVIRRDDVAVIDWDFTWDERKIATEMRITLLCEPFEFRAGEVFKLLDFGPASTGSTVSHPSKKAPKRPGHWLISEYTRPVGSLSTEFTLKQPTDPKKEPISELATRSDASDSAASGTLQEVAKHIGNADGNHYVWGGGHGPSLRTLKPPLGVDCSGLVSLALFRSDMWKGDKAMASGPIASSWGSHGKGTDFTVYANAGHVFMQGGAGKNKWRLDTGWNHSGTGKWYSEGEDAWRPTAGFTPRHWSG
jgi:hypothetical protein